LERELKKFWVERGKTYLYEGFHPSLEEFMVIAEAVLRNLKQIKFDSLLEVGCGCGHFLKVIHGHFPNKRLVGVDISRTMIRDALMYLEHQIPVLVANAYDLPFKNDEFDLAFTNVCLIHIPPNRIEWTVSEIMRVARKGLFVETSVEGLTVPYYFCHNYPRIFKSLGLDFSILETMDPRLNRKIYYVTRPSKKRDVKKILERLKQLGYM